MGRHEITGGKQMRRGRSPCTSGTASGTARMRAAGARPGATRSTIASPGHFVFERPIGHKLKDQADRHRLAIEGSVGLRWATAPLDKQHQRLAEGVRDVIWNSMP